MSGYSGTPLAQKLGINDSHRVYVSRGGPGGLLPGVRTVKQPHPPIDVAVMFVKTDAAYRAALDTMHHALAANGGLWIAWPKKASGVKTELTENLIRAIAVRETTLVDNKVCAIDDTWSALRLVVRKEHRASWLVP